MTDERFSVAEASREELDDLFRTPLFFKAVAVDTEQPVLDELLRADLEREATARRLNAEREQKSSDGDSSRNPKGLFESDTRPHWLAWGRDETGIVAEESPETVARRQQPQVLAKFSNGLPFLVERRLGRGDILFVATGVQSGWNNLTRTNAVVLFDRLLRGMLLRTLPRRNYATSERAVFAVAPADRRADFSLARPGGTSEPLFVDAVGSERFTVTARNLMQRGTYRVSAERLIETAQQPKGDQPPRGKSDPQHPALRADRLWQVDFAVNGPVEESDLKPIGEVELRQRVGDASLRWVGQGEPIRLEGSTVRGQEFWKYLMAATLAILLLELAVLVRSQSTTAATRTATAERMTAEAVP